MPFIKNIDREKMEIVAPDHFLYTDHAADIAVGDRCYYFYKIMVERFKKERRWTTAHNIYKEMIVKIEINRYSKDTKRAYELAWQMFFQLHIMPYELEKQKENGDIT